MQSFKFLIGTSALALLSACGGGGSTSSSAAGSGPSVSGGVVKGPVLGAAVCVYAINAGVKGALVPVSLSTGSAGTINSGCYVTPADGSYAFTLPTGTAGDVLLEATGGSFCTNEEPIANNACAGGGTLVNLGTAVMSSAVAVPATGTASVYTTPLTTAAVGAAAGATFSAATFNTQFNTLAGQIMGPAGAAVTPATLPTNGTQTYLSQVATYLQAGGTLGAAVSSLQQGVTSFPAPRGNASTNTPATVNAALARGYSLEFRASGGAGCGTLCSYAEGQSVAVTVHADGRLALPGKTLTNPFYRNLGAGPHLPEVIWLDSQANIEYALSDNSTGSFNEINVGDASRPTAAGIPRFLGQLRAPQANPATLLSAVAGTYPLAYQYKGAAVSWTGVTIAADGAMTFNGGTGPNITAANIAQTIDRLSCCGRIDIQLNIDLNGNGVDSQDKISLHKDASGALRSIEYDRGNNGVIADDTGVRVGTPAALPAHDGTAVPVTNAVNGTLGTTPLNFAINAANGNATWFSIEGTGGAGIAPLWSVSVSPGAAIQQGSTYNCRYTPTTTVRINVRTVANGSLLTTDDGGRCAITVTRYVLSGGGTLAELEGTFVAEIGEAKQSTAQRSVVNGVFRYLAP